jgi:hypothetical protein
MAASLGPHRAARRVLAHTGAAIGVTPLTRRTCLGIAAGGGDGKGGRDRYSGFSSAGKRSRMRFISASRTSR